MANKDRRRRRNQDEELDLLPGEEATDEGGQKDREEDEWVDVVRVDPENRETPLPTDALEEEELDYDVIDADINSEEVIDDMEEFTDDEDVLQDLAERQRLINEGSDALLERLRRHHSKTPDLSADDLDAAWEDSDVSGEESVGGSAPTPDQDIVDELGEAMGIDYEAGEPLHTESKLEARDRKRWELNPASAEDLEEQDEELEDLEEEELEEILEEDELSIEALEDEEDLEEEDLEDLLEEEEELDEKIDELEEEEKEDLDDEDDDYDDYDFDLDDEDLEDYLDDLDEDDDDDDY